MDGLWTRGKMDKTRILIVDDDEQFCAVLYQACVDWSMAPTTASNALLASETLQETFYNVVLLNVRTSLRSGLEVLADIGSRGPETKVIMMTEHADKEAAIRARNLGAFDFLEKPFSLDLLAHTVQRALQAQEIELERQHIFAELEQRQEELFQHQVQLQQVNDELTEANQALLMLTRDIEQSEVETICQLLLKVRALVLPIIEKFQQEGAFEKYVHELTVLARHIETLTTDITAILHATSTLSFSEWQVASLIKSGMTNRAIAMYLHITPDTVWTHRKNIRRKLNLTKTKYNLRTDLESLDRLDALHATRSKATSVSNKG
jgi:FixJ family two-component response regulator